MENGSALHRSVIAYLHGASSLEPVLDGLARELCREPRRYGLKDEDEVGEVYARYGPKLARLVERFEDRGLPFEAYLRTATKYFALSIRRRGARAADIEAVRLSDAVLGIADSEESPDSWYCSERPLPRRAPAGAKRSEKARKVLASRTGYLCLKCARSLDDEEIAVYAHRAGLSAAELQFKALAARAFAEDGRLRLERRARARDAAWIRYRSLARRLEREEDPWKRARYSLKLEHERDRFTRSLEAARHTRLTVSNRLVARLCGIAKGTVDAGIAKTAKNASSLQGLPPGGAFPLH